MDNSKQVYSPNHRLRDLVDDNNLILLVISRFGIPLGFGDNTIEYICKENNVDCDTFLAIANIISGQEYSRYKTALPDLIKYLENAHSYFLDFILPTIREKLISAINCHDTNDVGFLILKYYDDYVLEVRNHMEYENETIFPYIRHLINDKSGGEVNIKDYSLNHDSMAEKLQELKDIVIRHYRQTNSNLLNYVLYDIINCGNDLKSHCDIENRIFLPQAIKLEEECAATNGTIPATGKNICAASPETLSNREKEIIACFAKGMINKEIADHLCLSVHTVTTYRRNIAAKLQIHSPAGLVIYAILNNIIDIKDVKIQ
ncbi:MAG: LuxR C-terminal-related transcriptional regulator [Candidatus Aphodosoma sp.]